MSILFPQNHQFDDLFFELSESITDMVELFLEFTKDFTEFEKYAHKAAVIEGQADNATHKILNELQTAFITPYDREDLHALVTQLDDVVDDLESVIQSFYMYNITGKRDCVQEFAELYHEAAKHLNLLIKACFWKKKDAAKINLSKTIIAIHTIEGQWDEIYMKNIRDLFTKETEMLEITKWKVVIEGMEAAMDRFEKTASTVEWLKLKAG